MCESTVQIEGPHWAGCNLAIMNIQSVLAHLLGQGAHRTRLLALEVKSCPVLVWLSLLMPRSSLVVDPLSRDYRNGLPGGQGPRKLTVPKERGRALHPPGSSLCMPSCSATLGRAGGCPGAAQDQRREVRGQQSMLRPFPSLQAAG